MENRFFFFKANSSLKRRKRPFRLGKGLGGGRWPNLSAEPVVVQALLLALKAGSLRPAPFGNSPTVFETDSGIFLLPSHLHQLPTQWTSRRSAHDSQQLRCCGPLEQAELYLSL